MLARIKPRMSVPMSSSSSASSTLEQQYLPNSMLSENCMQQFLLNDPYLAGLNLKGSHNFCYNKEAPTLSMNYHQSNRMISPLSQSLLSEIATKMQHITMPMSLSSNLQSFSDHLSEGNQANFHQASALSLPRLKEWAYQNAVAGCGGSYTQLLTNPVGFSRMDSFSAMPQEAHALREFSQRLAGGALSRTVSDAASPALFESNLSQCLHQAALQQRSEPLPSCKSWNVSNSAMAGLVPDQNTFNGSIEGIAQYPFEHSGFAERATRFPSLTSENLSSFITPLATSGQQKTASLADPALRGSSMLVSGCEDTKDPKIQLNSKACYSEHKLPQSQADLYFEDVSKSISTMKKRRSGSDDSLSAGKRPKAEEQTVGDAAAGKRQKCQSSSKVKEEVKGKSNCSVETGPNVGGKDKAGKATDAPKQDYIHVRARRGQATDSHSLAERVRREKISERMRLLQDLVPGCSKITGKAMMLDEIINYVQSLQHQVEFLSMKLAALSPRVDFNFDNFYMGEVMPSEGSPTEVNANVSEMGTSASLSYQMLQSSMGAAVRDSCEDFCAPIPSESSLIDTKATTRSPCTANLPTKAFSQAACEWESNDNA